jgi:hypothetical protein
MLVKNTTYKARKMNGKYQDNDSQSSATKKEEFKQKAEEYYEDGILSAEEKIFLDLFGLEESEASEILQAIKVAYYQHQSDLDRYRKLLVTDPGKFVVEKQQLLQQLQVDLGLTDSQVENIKKDISTEKSIFTEEGDTEKSTMKSIVEDSTLKFSNAQSGKSQKESSEKQDLLGQQKQGISSFINHNNLAMAINTLQTYAPVVDKAISILGTLAMITFTSDEL